ncbi:MAG: peptidoglycan-binding domain-containing protein [Candidatus Rokuibacteriota bacterium]
MERWARIFAVAVAGAMVAGPVFAQSGGAGSGSGTTMPPQSGTQPQPGGASKDASSGGATSDTMKSDKAEGAMKGHAAGAKRSQVRAAQQALKDKGHDPGGVDGVMGPKTQAALRDFQKAEGIQTTGRLDAETMSKLGMAAGGRTSGTETGSPAASPKTGGASTGAAPSGASDTSKAPADKGAAQSQK